MMIDFDELPCPDCKKNNKEVKETLDEWFYIECKSCGYKTPKFRYVLSAQLYFIDYVEKEN